MIASLASSDLPAPAARATETTRPEPPRAAPAVDFLKEEKERNQAIQREMDERIKAKGRLADAAFVETLRTLTILGVAIAVGVGS